MFGLEAAGGKLEVREHRSQAAGKAPAVRRREVYRREHRLTADGAPLYHSRMRLSSNRRGSVRLLAALLALGANLLAAGAPVLHEGVHALHASSGEHADDHGESTRHAPTPTVHEGADHGHGEIHAAALHDAAAARPATASFVGLPPVHPVDIPVTAATEILLPFRPVARLSSRAPPPGDPARAPPLA